MRTPLLSLCLIVTLFISPGFAMAQTTSSDPSLIAYFTQLVQQLEQQIQQLIAGRASSQTTASSQSLSQPSFCTAYAALKRGDTDATTRGQVSELQAVLGISPTTGYYGALTGIGYTNKCVGGNAQPTSVPGMSKYTDSDFGFSFWYPSNAVVNQIAVQGSSPAGQTILKRLSITVLGVDLWIDEVTSSSGTFIVPGGACGYCAPVNFYFDRTQGAWMKQYPQGVGGADMLPGEFNKTKLPQLADVSHNTMGGLHIFSTEQKENASIIPLSAAHFVEVGDYSGRNPGSGIQSPLVQTIVATDPTVAIPVPTAQQITTIQAEASAYGINTAHGTIMSVAPTSGAAPLTVTFSGLTAGASDEVLDFGDNTIGVSTGPTGEWPNGGVVTHTYNAPGTYTAIVYRYLPNVPIQSFTVTVTGQSVSKNSYTNSRYGFSLQYPDTFIAETDPKLLALEDGTMGPDNTLLKLTATNPSLDASVFEVLVDSYQPDLQNCLTVPPTNETVYTNNGNTAINRISFLNYAYSNLSTGKSESGGIVYRAVHNSSCYTLFASSYANTFDNVIPVIQSFRFTQ